MSRDLCFGSVESTIDGEYDYRDLTAGGYLPGDDSIELLRAATLPGSGSTSAGGNDPGVGGMRTGVDIRLFVELDPGRDGSLDISGRYFDGVTFHPIRGAQISFIPEPSTSVLTALGLVALATNRCARERRAPSPAARSSS